VLPERPLRQGVLSLPIALQTVPAQGEAEGRSAAQAGGFSLHAGLDIEAGQHAKLERLCRYVSRPPLAVDRLALSASGQVRYTLQTPYCNGTTHLVPEPRDFMAVHMKAGLPCPRCGGRIAEVSANQRMTNFCRTCQPGGLLRGM
jgi:hypothetical protein